MCNGQQKRGLKSLAFSNLEALKSLVNAKAQAFENSSTRSQLQVVSLVHRASFSCLSAARAKVSNMNTAPRGSKDVVCTVPSKPVKCRRKLEAQ
eukprot:1259717-Amphidinium_carterae.1